MRIILLSIVWALALPHVLDAQTRTSQFEEFPVTGPETWSLMGSNYTIEGTGLLEGSIFVVRALVDHIPTEADRQDAQRIALFALVKGYRTNAGHFRFLDQFAVVDYEQIGVALIHKSEDAVSGYRFMFRSADLLGSEFVEGRIELPASLSGEPTTFALAKHVWSLLQQAHYEQIYDLLSAETRFSMTASAFRAEAERLARVLRECDLEGFSHYVFVGNTAGGPTFGLNYWIKQRGTGNLGLLSAVVHERSPLPTIVALNANVSSFYKR